MDKGKKMLYIFVIDVSASMEDCINDVTKAIGKLVKKLQVEYYNPEFIYYTIIPFSEKVDKKQIHPVSQIRYFKTPSLSPKGSTDLTCGLRCGLEIRDSWAKNNSNYLLKSNLFLVTDRDDKDLTNYNLFVKTIERFCLDKNNVLNLIAIKKARLEEFSEISSSFFKIFSLKEIDDLVFFEAKGKRLNYINLSPVIGISGIEITNATRAIISITLISLALCSISIFSYSSFLSFTAISLGPEIIEEAEPSGSLNDSISEKTKSIPKLKGFVPDAKYISTSKGISIILEYDLDTTSLAFNIANYGLGKYQLKDLEQNWILIQQMGDLISLLESEINLNEKNVFLTIHGNTDSSEYRKEGDIYKGENIENEAYLFDTHKKEMSLKNGEKFYTNEVLAFLRGRELKNYFYSNFNELAEEITEVRQHISLNDKKGAEYRSARLILEIENLSKEEKDIIIEKLK